MGFNSGFKWLIIESDIQACSQGGGGCKRVHCTHYKYECTH